MKHLTLKDSDIDSILNPSLTIKHWEFQLGVGYVYEGLSDRIKFSKPYPEIGLKFWKLLHPDLHNLFCVDGNPKEWVNDLVTGDGRNVITGIVSAITAQYDVTLAIAVPIAALLLKYDFINFCRLATKQDVSREEIVDSIKKKTIEKKLLKPQKKGAKKKPN